jgi:hypothetical protein
VCTWGIPNRAPLQRLSSIRIPDLVANGDSDPVPRSTARLPENGEAVVGEWVAIGSFCTACAGQDLAGSSLDGAEAGITSVGRRG